MPNHREALTLKTRLHRFAPLYESLKTFRIRDTDNNTYNVTCNDWEFEVSLAFCAGHVGRSGQDASQQYICHACDMTCPVVTIA